MSRMKKQTSEHYYVAYISFTNLLKSEFDGIVSKRDKLQKLDLKKLKLEVHYSYEKDLNITTNFEAVDNEDVINKAYIDKKIKKTDVHISYIEKDYNELELQYNKQRVEEILIQRAVKTTYKFCMIRVCMMFISMLMRF